MLAVTLLICAGLWFVLHWTRLGKAMRACANDRLAAQTIGIDPRRMVLFSYLGSALLGAVAGILLTPTLMMSYDNGVMLALKGFTAAVAGGLVSPFGAIAGGLLIGVLEGLGVGLVSSELQNAYAFLALLLVLLVRPQGLFGRGPARASS
jgi:branched-chain amino acid transport system permease protein